MLKGVNNPTSLKHVFVLGNIYLDNFYIIYIYEFVDAIRTRYQRRSIK